MPHSKKKGEVMATSPPRLPNRWVKTPGDQESSKRILARTDHGKHNRNNLIFYSIFNALHVKWRETLPRPCKPRLKRPEFSPINIP